MSQFSLFEKLQIVRLPHEYDLKPVPFKGSEKKPILVVGSNFAEEDKKFIFKVIDSIQYDRNSEVTVTQLKENECLSYDEIEQTETEIIMIFDLDPKSMGLTKKVTKYVLYTIGGKKLIFCDDVQSVLQSKSLKLKLWSQLKHLKKSHE